MKTILKKIKQLEIEGGQELVMLECIRYRRCTVGLMMQNEEARAAVIHFCESMLDAGCGDLEALSMALNKPIHFKIYAASTRTGVAGVIVMENGNTVVLELETYDEAVASECLCSERGHMHTHEANARLGGNHGI